MIYLFYLLLACKPDKKESLGSIPVDIEPSSEANTELSWTGNSLEEEFGFQLLKWNSKIYASDPHRSEGTIYRLTEDGRNEVFSGLGRLGHQIFIWNDTLYAHAPLLERIVDADGNILAEGVFGKIVATEEHWYAISGKDLLQDGEIWQSFESKPYDLAICNETIGLSFPFGAQKLWVGGQWYFEADQVLDRYLHCIHHNDSVQWLLGGENRLLILDGEMTSELPSEHQGFGQEVASREVGSQLEVFVSAPDGGANLKGWVGRYLWSTKTLFQEWTGRRPNQRFGYAILLEYDGILISSPNSLEASNKASNIRKFPLSE
jgi:hypothetical protein